MYQNSGLYTVTLIVTNASGCTDTLIYPTQINVSSPNVNYVSPAPISACAPHTVNFADNSGAVAWLWDFGDGTTSTVSNPTHTYTSAGTFVVSLSTSGANGGCARVIQNFETFIIDAGTPKYSYTVSPCPPYEVYFTDSSQNAVAWLWSFGDGTTSTLQNPSHIYGNPGSFNINLTITTPGGCNTTLSVNNGVHFTGLGANASAICNDTVPPFHVLFYANATNATQYFWDFGDGTTSTLANPPHTYTTNGPFNLTLIISNDSCSFTYNYPPTSFGSATGGGGTPIGGIDPTYC